MMVTLYNPHVDDFLAEPPHFKILKRRALKKYGFVISESLRKGDEIKVLIDGTSSAFIPESIFHKLPDVIRQAVASFEYWLWKRINGFGSSIKRVQPPEAKCDDVLLAFSYKAATGDFPLRFEVLDKYRAVVFHLSHYFVSTSEKANNIQSLRNAWLAGDSDITGNAYFRGFFSWYKKPFLVLSFAVSPRFSVRKIFSARQSRCVATGTFHDLTQEYPKRKYVDFITTTHSTTCHPIRKEVFESGESIASLVECRVSPYRRYGPQPRMFKLLRHLAVSQKKYFSSDIVDLYNDYQFALVGEELSGFPALGAFEAMACGCVLVANPNCYAGLGLVPHKHYLPYEGSLARLAETLNFEDKGHAEEIASNAAKYVSEEFSQTSMMGKWTRVFAAIADEEYAPNVERAMVVGFQPEAGNRVLGSGD